VTFSFRIHDTVILAYVCVRADLCSRGTVSVIDKSIGQRAGRPKLEFCWFCIFVFYSHDQNYSVAYVNVISVRL
jgi:hypothetical protein